LLFSLPKRANLKTELLPKESVFVGDFAGHAFSVFVDRRKIFSRRVELMLDCAYQTSCSAPAMNFVKRSFPAMFKNSVRACFVVIPTLFALCCLVAAPAHAQNMGDDNYGAELYQKFSAAQKLPCGQREDAVVAGREIVEKYANDKSNKAVVEFVKKRLAEIIAEEIKCDAELSLPKLYDKFRAALKMPCEERGAAIPLGKLIIGLYSDDPLNPTVVAFVRNRVGIIEKEVPVCIRDNAYNRAMSAKNWARVFATGKVIIDAEGDTPKALDVMLDLVQVGYDRMAYDDNDSYNIETVGYAIKALELMEKGGRTMRCWGVFLCFEGKDKTLGWLNYIVGYISYFQLKGDKKALPYFYRSTQYKMEFKYDAFVYQAVAKYYFDRQASMPSGLTIGAFINRAQAIANRSSETGNNFTSESAEDDEVAMLYKQLVNLYSLRYNLEENENVADLGAYIQILLDRPLIEPSKNKGKSSK
jgi:hypothetical protein